MTVIACVCLVLALELVVVGWDGCSIATLFRSPRAALVDGAFALVAAVGLRDVAELVFTFGLYGFLTAACSHLPSLRLSTGSFWCDVTLQVIIVDFFGYWLHRLQHTRLLWWAHKLHHDALALTPFTNYRHNPAEAVFRPLAIAAPALILVPQPLPFLLALVLYKFQGLYLHSALPWKHGGLSWLLNSPAAHRVHHSQNPAHFNRNFGALLMIWDHLFSTQSR